MFGKILQWSHQVLDGHLCCVPDVRGKAFSFFPFYIILAMSLSYIFFYYAEVCSFYIQFSKVFLIMKSCRLLSNAFSTSIEMIIRFLSIILLIWHITLIDLHLNHPCNPGINPNWSWMNDLFNILLNLVC